MGQNDVSNIKKILTKNNLDPDMKISEIPSGQINRVYSLGNEYIIKFQGDIITAPYNLFEHQARLMQELEKIGALVPQLIDSGTLDEKNYLFMGRIPGKNLATDWINFSEKEKERLIEQLCEQLRLMHSVRYEQYAIETFKEEYFDSFQDCVLHDINFSRIKKDNDRVNELVSFLKEFYESKKDLLSISGSPVLIHNDIHFENIFHNDGQLSGIIDFDFSCQAPAEYELCLMTDFFYIPTNFVEKSLEKSYAEYDLSHEARWVKQYYPEMFEKDHLADRLRLYSITSIIGQLEEFQDEVWSEKVLEKLEKKVEDIYRGDFIETLYNV